LIRFWRDPDGPEVDWVVEGRGVLVPVEVKWTDTPGKRDVPHRFPRIPFRQECRANL
jgi:uncharacterized protein